MANTPLRKLTVEQIQAFVNEKRVTGLSARTIHYLYSVLHHALEQAQILGLVSRNMARLVRLPRMTRTKVHPFNPVQARISSMRFAEIAWKPCARSLWPAVCARVKSSASNGTTSTWNEGA